MADLHRRRRSSISEQIQRVFNVDFSEKRRGVQTENNLSAVLAQLKNEHEKSEATISPRPVQFGQDETRPSSFTYSQNSGLPSTDTPHSTPPFRPVISLDTMSQVEVKRPAVQDICTSPTWDKGRKERRATRRLEAERKELEERLLRLEEAQSRLDHGVFERTSHRLTKKQPLDSASRSSSTDRERGRSSSVFSGIFSRSRRSSRSRANSKVSESRRLSNDTPPTLPLALPERFGAAVSRELATRHGTTLVPSHQLERTENALHTLHAAPKSDDLRESWSMAEAWQRNNGTRDFDPARSAVYKLEPSVDGQFAPGAQPYVQATELSADLDRELFTATLRHERKPAVNRSASNPQANAPARPKASQRDRVQSEIHQQVPDAMSTRVTTARQLHDLAPPDTMQGPYKAFTSSNSVPGIPKSKHHKNSAASGYQVNTKSFKSSPLSSNPYTTNDSERKENNRMSRASTTQNMDQSIIPPPLRIQLPQQHDESRGRIQQPGSDRLAATDQGRPKDTLRGEHRQSIQGPFPSSGNGNGQQEKWRSKPPTTTMDTTPPQDPAAANQSRSDGPPLPVKHAGRTSSLGNSPPKWANNENQREGGVLAEVPANLSESSGQNQYIAECPENKPVLRCVNPPVLSRTTSQSSSQASYDTADEEVLDVSKALRNYLKVKAQPSETGPFTPTKEGSAVKERLSNDTTQNNTPPLARNGSLSMFRKRPKQKAKSPQLKQLIAKLFVICCNCKYWHDMPSEVYAKLACPERLPSESLLSRTFSRRNSVSRKASLRNSLLSSDPSNTRRLLTTDRKYPNKHLPSSRETLAAAGVPLTPPSCCWCGHNMSKTCCQGWTTLVQMGERHH